MITVDGNHISIENIKIQNVTYVDGNQVQNKVLTVSSKVQLGTEKIAIPLRQIIQLATGKANTHTVPTFSLQPMEAVWERYNEEMLQIDIDAAIKQKKERKKRNLQGLCSSAGMLFVLIPQLGYVRFLLMGISVLIMLYFFLKKDDDDITAVKKNNLRDEFARKYKCPNPECGKPFGNIPYHQIKFYKKCLACGCNYTVITPPIATEVKENAATVTPVAVSKGLNKTPFILLAVIALMVIIGFGVQEYLATRSETPPMITESPSSTDASKASTESPSRADAPKTSAEISTSEAPVVPEAIAASASVSEGARPEPVEESGSAKKEKEEAHTQADKVHEDTNKKAQPAKSDEVQQYSEPQPNSLISFPFGTYSGPDDGNGNGNRGMIRVTSPYTLSTNGDDLHLEPGDEIRNVQIRSGKIRAGQWIHNGEKISFNR